MIRTTACREGWSVVIRCRSSPGPENQKPTRLPLLERSFVAAGTFANLIEKKPEAQASPFDSFASESQGEPLLNSCLSNLLYDAWILRSQCRTGSIFVCLEQNHLDDPRTPYSSFSAL
jgi:hypothetical protein